MKTVEIKVYKYDELSDKAKEKALNWFAEGALDYGWWDATYEDAKTIGCKIKSFDLDRECDLVLEDSFLEVLDAILKNHGETCDTFKLAKEYQKRFDDTLAQFNADDCFEESEQYELLKEEFQKALAEEYRIMLQKEYEHLSSREQVEESIRANEYDFTEDGRIFKQ